MVADGSCDVGKGSPIEDLLVGVTSFDPDRPDYGECSIHTSVAHYRNWILATMAGKIPPSTCKVKEQPPRTPGPDPCEECEVDPVPTVASLLCPGRWLIRRPGSLAISGCQRLIRAHLLL